MPQACGSQEVGEALHRTGLEKEVNMMLQRRFLSAIWTFYPRLPR